MSTKNVLILVLEILASRSRTPTKTHLRFQSPLLWRRKENARNEVSQTGHIRSSGFLKGLLLRRRSYLVPNSSGCLTELNKKASSDKCKNKLLTLFLMNSPGLWKGVEYSKKSVEPK